MPSKCPQKNSLCNYVVALLERVIQTNGMVLYHTRVVISSTVGIQYKKKQGRGCLRFRAVGSTGTAREPYLCHPIPHLTLNIDIAQLLKFVRVAPLLALFDSIIYQYGSTSRPSSSSITPPAAATAGTEGRKNQPSDRVGHVFNDTLLCSYASQIRANSP